MSSFESMSAYLSQPHWGVHGGGPPDSCTIDPGNNNHCTGSNVMAQRNYPCDNFIIVYFGGNDSVLDQVGEFPFKRQLYQCMIGQALQMKSSMESHRATNQFGTMIWQLNEIWPTGGWGSIEYGYPSGPGQVPGGRWKPLHYFLMNNGFTDVTVACGKGGLCMVKNDRAALPFVGHVLVEAVAFSTGATSTLLTVPLSLPAGPGVTQWFSFDGSALDGTQAIVRVTAVDSSGATVASNVEAYTTPQFMKLPQASVSLSVSQSPNPDSSVTITLTSPAVTVYTVLTTQAAGRFSDNAFLLVPPSATVTFIPFGALDLALLTSTLRVEHAAMYM